MRRGVLTLGDEGGGENVEADGRLEVGLALIGLSEPPEEQGAEDCAGESADGEAPEDGPVDVATVGDHAGGVAGELGDRVDGDGVGVGEEAEDDGQEEDAAAHPDDGGDGGGDEGGHQEGGQHPVHGAGLRSKDSSGDSSGCCHFL